MIYQALGQTERALDWLEKAYSNLEGELNWVHQDPEFASLRTHPRYRSLAQQMKDRYRALTF
jgi:acyl dehydratase